MDRFQIRPIKPADNAALAKIIRHSLAEFGADKPGTVYFDDSTDHLYELFQKPRAQYYVAFINNEIAGGAGIFPTSGLEADTCELVKLYLAASARGIGLGKLLMQYCLDAAKENGFKKIYLETMPELTMAVPMYEQYGFAYLQKPLGNSGHNACGIWMLKELE